MYVYYAFAVLRNVKKKREKGVRKGIKIANCRDFGGIGGPGVLRLCVCTKLSGNKSSIDVYIYMYIYTFISSLSSCRNN